LKHVCRSIAIAGHSGDVATVQSGLTHEEPEVRVVALTAAHRLGLLDSQVLSRFFEDPSPDVRYRTIELAARVSFGNELVPHLFRALKDPELCELSCFALGEIELDEQSKSEAERQLSLIVSTNEDPLEREAAVAALGSLHCGLEAILKATSDVATVRRRAVLALAPFEGADVEAALAKALDDRDWQVRQAAEDLTS